MRGRERGEGDGGPRNFFGPAEKHENRTMSLYIAITLFKCITSTRSRRLAGRRMPSPEHARTHARTDGQLANIMPSRQPVGWEAEVIVRTTEQSRWFLLLLLFWLAVAPLGVCRGGFRHVQHVRPNRGPHKKGALTKRQFFFHFLATW